MTNKQKEEIVRILEQCKENSSPEEIATLNELIFAVKASSPYPKPTERVIREE